MNQRTKTMMIMTLAIAVIAVGLLPQAGPATRIVGTRAGEVGWQYDTFTQNIEVNVTPESITTLDQIIVTIDSTVPEVAISQASLYGVVYPDDGFQFPISFPFFKVDNGGMTFRCIIEPFAQFSGYEIEFYIVAYDYFNTPMDSRTSNLYFNYEAVGSGWKHETFAENIEVRYWPLRANASEEVTIELISRENVTIKGANLWVTYETAEGDVEEGGWNFSKANVNSTIMRKSIPGYPAGTNVTFWVIAWDEYNIQMVSRFYNYSVVGIVEYTDFPFEYTDDTGDKSLWIPDDSIILPMAGVCALAIPLFIYLYAIDLRRRKRAVSLVKSKDNGKPDVPKEGPEPVEETGGEKDD